MAAQRGEAIPYMRAWRRDKLMEQQELATQAKVSPSTIQRAERGGTISIPNIRKIAAALGISTEQLRREDPSRAREAVAQ